MQALPEHSHLGRFDENIVASAGSRTRIDCLEGNHANRYTTDAAYKVNLMSFWHHLMCI